MPVTLKDVAQRAQVSLSTVSMAMGSSGRISADTRRRVLKIAEEMGYRPNMLVRGMQKGRTLSVGVLMNFSGDFYESRIFQGVHHTLVKSGYVPITLMPTEELTVLEQIHSLLDRRVDGVLLRPSGEAKWEKHLHEALDRQVPVVSVDTETQAEGRGRQIDFVGTGDFQGGQLVAEAFLEAGHQHLAVITTGFRDDPMQHRREGFESVFQKKGGTVCVSANQPWDWENISSPDVAKRLLSLQPRPTGIFVTMDWLAVGVYQAARALGLRIPEDLSVVGFADEPVAAQLTPPLTTLHQQPREIGVLGARLLLERIESGSVPGERKRLLIDPEWVARGSLGPAPDGKHA